MVPDTNWKTWCSMVREQICTIHHKNGPKLVTNAWIDWFHMFITHVNTNTIVMWVILQNNADWDCFNTQTLQEILKIQNLHQVEHCAFLEAIRLHQSVGCKKQNSVSHSSVESEIISLDAGLRMDGIPASSTTSRLVSGCRWSDKWLLFWSMSGNCIYRHHVEPRIKLYSPKEESFPIPLNYIDVSRTTHTNLDVKQGYTWYGERLTRKQLTSRQDHWCPEVWKTMGKNAKLKERQKWSNEQLHLENAWKLRGSISLTQRTRNSKKPSRMHVRIWQHNCSCCALPNYEEEFWEWCTQQNQNKTCVHSGSWWIYKTAYGRSLPTHHEDHIAGKGSNSLQHCNLVHKFTPLLQAIKIPAAKAAVDQKREKLENFGVGSGKSQK